MQWIWRLIFCVMAMSGIIFAAETDETQTKVSTIINQFQDSGFKPQNNIITRDRWGAADQNVSGISKQPFITRFILGHTVTDGDDTIEVVAKMQIDQINKSKWADIGYHFCVDDHAKVFIGRSPDQVPVIYLGNNPNSCAIGFIGNFHTKEVDNNKPKKVTDEMVYRFGRVLAYLVTDLSSKKYLADAVDWKELKRHYNLFCMCDLMDPKTGNNKFPDSPGENFTKRLAEILGVANYYLAQSDHQ